MFRITKVLNHNTVLAVKDKSTQEYLIVGKGIGFGKKALENENIFQNFLFGRTDRADADTQRRIVDAWGKIGGKQQRCER